MVPAEMEQTPWNLEAGKEETNMSFTFLNYERISDVHDESEEHKARQFLCNARKSSNLLQSLLIRIEQLE
ncbi:exosome complex component RRP4-like protein [Gossypium australe]|uniref:Exosome complex component RRP4-like protein n=1 Tax=Gossypium australe TaxID=47621 RepID=A0A5B6WEX8_9ROSI|nr:exosome complex component RRP4-like protein [Gossypium australe]